MPVPPPFHFRGAHVQKIAKECRVCGGWIDSGQKGTGESLGRNESGPKRRISAMCDLLPKANKDTDTEERCRKEIGYNRDSGSS